MRSSPRCLFLAPAVLAAAPLASQQVVTNFRHHYPVTDDQTTGGLVADWNGDGLGDLFAFGASGPQRMYFSDGNAFLTPAQAASPFGGGVADDAGALDANGDGRLDLLVLRGAQVELWSNGGGGTFTQVPGAFPTFATGALKLHTADIDGDGDLDVYAASGNGGRGFLFENLGANGFADRSSNVFVLGGTYDVAAFADLDGQNGPDLVRASWQSTGTPRVAFNDGAGNFTTAVPLLAGFTLDVGQIEARDVDGDGVLDVGMSDGSLSPAQGPFAWLRNTGGGAFTGPNWVGPGTATGGFALEDLDGDGAAELILNSFYAPAGPTLWSNDGGGNFTRTPRPEMTTEAFAYGIEAGDLDGDGDRELFVANLGYPDLLLRNRGDATFERLSPADVPPLVHGYQSAAAGDLDGDGDDDLVIGLEQGSFRIWMNDDTGEFVDESAARLTPAPPTQWNAFVTLLDLDSDGDLDILSLAEGGLGGPSLAYANQGNGNFVTVSTQWVSAVPGYLDGKVRAGDLNGDGRVDLVDDTGTGARVLLNNGFTWTVGATIGSFPYDMELADLDGDTDLDLVMEVPAAGSGSTGAVWLGDGLGGFSFSGGAFPAGFSDNLSGLGLHDVDADGDLDAFFGAWRFTPQLLQGGYVFTNDGTGAFTDQTSTYWPNFFGTNADLAVTDFAFPDLDGDGRGDLVVSQWAPNRGGGIERSWTADAQGRFLGPGTPLDPGNGQTTHALVVADFDEDQDDDLLTVDRNGPMRIHHNLIRQQSFRGRPNAIGTYRLEFRNEPGAAAFLFGALLQPNPARLSFPPWGTWKLGGASGPLGNFTLPASGSFTFRFPLALPSGTTVWWQTVFVEPSLADFRISGLERTEF